MTVTGRLFVRAAKAVSTKIEFKRASDASTVFSGAVGEARDERSQLTNKRHAFERMANSKRFKAWHRVECARRLGEPTIDEIVDREMGNIKIEYL